MNRTKQSQRRGAPPFSRMALRFFDEACEVMGDEHLAAMIASATLMAAVDKLQARRSARACGSALPSTDVGDSTRRRSPLP